MPGKNLMIEAKDEQLASPDPRSLGRAVANLPDDEVVVFGDELPRLAAVRIVPMVHKSPMESAGRRVKVTWRDGRDAVVDLAPVIMSHRHFIPLRPGQPGADDLFRTVRIGADGMALEWDAPAAGAVLELVADWVAELPAVDLTNADFRRIMDDKLDLSLDGMAAQLGVSRRLVADYRGSKPIPPTVAYATRYLSEHAQGKAPRHVAAAAKAAAPAKKAAPAAKKAAIAAKKSAPAKKAPARKMTWSKFGGRKTRG